jgi:hypothetical protein
MVGRSSVAPGARIAAKAAIVGDREPSHRSFAVNRVFTQRRPRR